MSGGRLLTPEELADRWQLEGKNPKAAAWRLAREGVIPAGAVVRLGRNIRFRLEGIEAFEAEGGKGLEE
jgi:hypothetical protein